jgi:hypothetical protein
MQVKHEKHVLDQKAFSHVRAHVYKLTIYLMIGKLRVGFFRHEFLTRTTSFTLPNRSCPARRRRAVFPEKTQKEKINK